MELEYDPVTFRASDYTTAIDYSERVGVTEAAVRKWIQLQGIKAVGRYPFPDNRKVYLSADLEAAELATRLRAPDRGVPEIAGWQRIQRAEQRSSAA